MLHALCVFLAILVLASELPAAPTAEGLPAELTARSPRNRARRDEAKPDKPIRCLLGDLADPAPGGPAATAKAFLEKHGTLLGFPAGTKFPGNLETLRDEKSDTGHELKLVPTRNGVPFLGGTIAFTFATSGKLVGVSGRYRTLDDARMGQMSAGKAAEKALTLMATEIPGSYLSADGTVREHIAYGTDGGLEHVYEIELSLGRSRSPYLVTLDHAGNMLSHEPSARAYEGTGKAFKTYPSLTPETVTLTDLMPTVTNGMYFPLMGKYFVPASQAIMHAGSRAGKFDYPVRLGGEIGLDLFFNDPRFLEVNVYHHLMTARKHAIDAAKVDAEKLDVGKPLIYDVWQYPDANNGMSFNNAYYVNPSREWHFPVINPRFPSSPPLFLTAAIDAAAIYHEFGHHVLNSITPDVEINAMFCEQKVESRSIVEGFSDYFAYTMVNRDPLPVIFKTKDGKGPRPVGASDVDFCKIRDVFNRGQWDPHIHGLLFSQLCRDLERVYEGRTLSTVVKALAGALPRTFANFGDEMAKIAEAGGETTADQVEEILKVRKIFDCDLGETVVGKPEDNRCNELLKEKIAQTRAEAAAAAAEAQE